jgi:transposase-like protein
MPDFIESIEPGDCPSCYSTNVTTKRGGFVCKNCGNEWTEADENFAKGMTPEWEEGQAALYRKLGGKENL